MSSLASRSSSFTTTMSPLFGERTPNRYNNDHSHALLTSQFNQHSLQSSALTGLSLCDDEDSSDSEDDESVYYTAEEDFFSDEEDCYWDEEENNNVYEKHTPFNTNSNNANPGMLFPNQSEDLDVSLPPLWGPEEGELSFQKCAAGGLTLPPLWDHLSFLTKPDLEQRPHIQSQTPPQHPKMSLSYITNPFHVEPTSLLPRPFSDQMETETHSIHSSQLEASQAHSSAATSMQSSSFSSFSSPAWSFVPDCSSDLNVYAHSLTPAVYLAHPSREPGNNVWRPPLPGPLIVP